MQELPLGKTSVYADVYAPDLLVAVARQPIREKLDIASDNMLGEDIWNLWEVSWLEPSGKPAIGCFELRYPSDSLNIVESKSLKLYLNSLNQTVYDSKMSVMATIRSDLEKVITSPVSLSELDKGCLDTAWIDDYHCIDDSPVEIKHYQPAPELLVTRSETVLEERLVSHLFKTNCMVTGQPDWASVFINYRGEAINHQQLLAYLVSFRNHQAFHEPSCEMIFSDLHHRYSLEKLSVYCRYTRRGGIDINPYRSTAPEQLINQRTMRQ